MEVRIAAAVVQDDTGGAERERRPENTADVVRISNALEHEQPLCSEQPLQRAARLWPVRQREAPAVKIEPRHRLHDVCLADEHNRAAPLEDLFQAGKGRRSDHDRLNVEPRVVQQPLDDEPPLGDEQTAPAERGWIADVPIRSELLVVQADDATDGGGHRLNRIW
jgi:hypothetical protein